MNRGLHCVCIYSIIVQGFCDTECIVDENRGAFKWDESGVNTTVTTSCPFGPSGAVVTRSCEMRLNYSVPIIDVCATFITPEFIALNGTIDQVCWEELLIKH